MVWTVEIEERAEKQLSKIDIGDARRIRKFLRERIAGTDYPRQVGTALVAASSGIFGDTGWATTEFCAISRTTG